MSKGMYDSDEESFFEPPKLSSYGTAILNENKENVLSELLEENQSLPVEQDIDIILTENEVPPSTTHPSKERKRSSFPRKSSIMGSSRIFNPLGHPRRVSSRKSSGGHPTDENHREENDMTNSITSHSQVTPENHGSHNYNGNGNVNINNNSNTITNDTSFYEMEMKYDYKNTNPQSSVEANDDIQNKASRILEAYENEKQRLEANQDDDSSTEEKSEQELYEKLRKNRLLQEELERNKIEELERLHREEQRRQQIQREHERMLEEQRQRELREQRYESQRLKELREHERLEREKAKEQKMKKQRYYDNKENIPRYEYKTPTPPPKAQPKREIEVITDVIPLKQEYESSPKQVHHILVVNNIQYDILELIGKGGSSKVYKARHRNNNKIYAIKKVLFDEFDSSSVDGFKGEIDLLVRLRDKKRVVRLVDYSLNNGCLHLVMECGDIDLARVLNSRLKFPLNLDAVRFYAKELFYCVEEVHDSDIVHSDLKPANFLFVKGTLKLIDFGISNAVPDHTVNIYRNSQIGTPNYMAPEALVSNTTNNNDEGTWKVGKPSDIWSCGCIIYQMIYGKPPYGHLSGHQRIIAIMNPDVQISYPDVGIGGSKVPKAAIQLMKSCLIRNPKDRATIPNLMKGSFLNPRIVTEQFLRDLIGSAIQYGATNGNVGKDEVNELASDVWNKISSLNY